MTNDIYDIFFESNKIEYSHKFTDDFRPDLETFENDPDVSEKINKTFLPRAIYNIVIDIEVKINNKTFRISFEHTIKNNQPSTQLRHVENKSFSDLEHYVLDLTDGHIFNKDDDKIQLVNIYHILFCIISCARTLAQKEYNNIFEENYFEQMKGVYHD